VAANWSDFNLALAATTVRQGLPSLRENDRGATPAKKANVENGKAHDNARISDRDLGIPVAASEPGTVRRTRPAGADRRYSDGVGAAVAVIDAQGSRVIAYGKREAMRIAIPYPLSLRSPKSSAAGPGCGCGGAANTWSLMPFFDRLQALTRMHGTFCGNVPHERP
jgi:hypothetical protein